MVNVRAERAGAALYKFIFYVIASSTSYMVMKDSTCLPWFMGGTGSMDAIFDSVGFEKQDPYFLELQLVSLGYFLEDFINHIFFKERSSDFWEMFLHHSMTLTLISGTIL